MSGTATQRSVSGRFGREEPKRAGGARVRQAAAHLAVAGAILLGAVSCEEGIFAPRPAPARRAVLSLQPQLAHVSDGSFNPARLVDILRVRITRATGASALDTAIAWPADRDTLRAEVESEVSGEQELFRVLLEARAGQTVYFRLADDTLTVSGTREPRALQPVLSYVGPGSSVRSVAIRGAPATLRAGERVQLVVAALDAQGNAVADAPIAWGVGDASVVAVAAGGALTAARKVGATVVRAWVAFTAVADSVRLSVVPARVALTPRADTLTALGEAVELRAAALDVGGR